LIKSGLISISADSEPVQTASAESTNNDSKLAALEAELEKCSEIVKVYKRIDCEKPVNRAIELYKYQTDAERFDVGPITYYWFGIGSEGNEFKITPTGQPILTIRMLAENTGSDITALNCTSPAICAYTVSDGSKAFRYSGTIPLTFSDSSYGLRITGLSGILMYSPVSAQVISELEPGDEIEFSWNQIKNDGDKALEGLYKISAKGVDIQGSKVEKSTTITIWK